MSVKELIRRLSALPRARIVVASYCDKRPMKTPIPAVYFDGANEYPCEIIAKYVLLEDFFIRLQDNRFMVVPAHSVRMPEIVSDTPCNNTYYGATI